MPLNNHSLQEIPQTVIDAITTKLQEIQAALEPFATPLTSDERKAMLKLGDKSEAFIQKTNDYVTTNPQLKPGFFNEAAFHVDFDNLQKLRPIQHLAEQISNIINDTAMVCGEDVFNAALMYYNNVKNAEKAGIPNAGQVYDDLRQRFPGRKSKDTPPPSL